MKLSSKKEEIRSFVVYNKDIKTKPNWFQQTGYCKNERWYQWTSNLHTIISMFSIWMRALPFTKKQWDVSVTKTKRWEFTSSVTPTATGWKLFQKRCNYFFLINYSPNLTKKGTFSKRFLFSCLVFSKKQSGKCNHFPLYLLRLIIQLLERLLGKRLRKHHSRCICLDRFRICLLLQR